MEEAVRNELESHWLGHILGKALSSTAMVKRRVDHDLKLVKGDRDLNADWLVLRKTRLNTSAGVVSGAMSFIPIMGSIGALTITGVSEFAFVLKNEIELCIELAHNYGHDVDDTMRMFEVLAIIGRRRDIKNLEDAKDAASGLALNTAIRRYVSIGIFKALTRAAAKIEVRFGIRAAVKAVPAIGTVVGGVINYKMTRNTGRIAKSYYEN